jgi:IS5 family transposase
VVQQLAHQQLAVHNVLAAVHQIVVPVAVALQVHLEKMQARAASANLNLEKRYAMNSTICKRRNWVAQLFRTAMERLQFVCDAVQHLQISQKRLVQMQQL